MTAIGASSQNKTNVSIHTPTQGVTQNVALRYRSCSSFNPHTHAGCDGKSGHVTIHQDGFNPHTHAGCDTLTAGNNTTTSVSIHTPTQGVTDQKNVNVVKNVVSIHTPTQGVTSCHRVSSALESFNPHTHAGCDRGFNFCSLY